MTTDLAKLPALSLEATPKGHITQCHALDDPTPHSHEPNHSLKPPHPQDADATIKVIGCGLPRTGTTSLGAALSILLNGPVYDGGMHARLGPPERQQWALEVVSLCPERSTVERTLVQYRLAQLTAGHVATTDAPGCYYVAELLALYPCAIAVYTVRDRASWWASYCGMCTRLHECSVLGGWPWLPRRTVRFLN